MRPLRAPDEGLGFGALFVGPAGRGVFAGRRGAPGVPNVHYRATVHLAMGELWAPIVGYEGLYEVSDRGRVKSLPRTGTRGGIIRFDNDSNGYSTVRLSRAGRKTHLAVHGLVMGAFVGPRPDGHECRHLNGDRTDNRLANLRWGTSSENSQDMVDHGRTNSRITHCPQGHEYDSGNTYVWGGRRYCRACNRNYTRDRQRRVRAQRKDQRGGSGA